MPNNHQILFLASFLSLSVVLFSAHWYIGNKLRDAGYDVSRLILIGLNSSDTARPANGTNMSTTFFDIQNNQLTQLVAIALAVASSAFFFFKFGRTREFVTTYMSTRLCTHTWLRAQRKSQFSIPRNGRSSL